MNMRTMIAAGVVAVAGLAGAANAQNVFLPFSINNVHATNANNSQTSATASGTGGSYNWTIGISSLQFTTDTGFGQFPDDIAVDALGSMGVTPADLTASGVASGPGVLFNHNFVFTQPGGSAPVWDFNIKMILGSDLKVTTQVVVNSLSTINQFGLDYPVVAISASGNAFVVPNQIPAPGPVALVACGGLLACRRRRSAQNA